MEINGPISAALAPKIRAALDAIEPDRFPAGAIVLLNSQGGDGLAAIEIGRIVRAVRAHVFVRGRCASACTYVLAGGVVRGVARDHAVGIHSPRLTTDEYVRRTLAMPEICLAARTPAQEFVRCYRRVLQTGG